MDSKISHIMKIHPPPPLLVATKFMGINYLLCIFGLEHMLFEGIVHSLYTEFHFLQVLLGLLIPCMSRISTSAMS